MPRADVEPGWSGIGPTAFFTAALPAIEGEIGSATFLAASSGHWGAAEGEMGGMGSTIFLTAALARPRVRYVQQHFSQRPWGATESEMGGMGPTIFLAAALARPRVKYVQQHFSQRTLGRHRERNGRNGSNNISHSSAGGRWRNRPSNISYSSGGHGQVGVMAEGAGNRSSNIFRITVAGQRDRGEKERNRSNTGPRRPLSYRHGDRPSKLRSEGLVRTSVSDETETACGGRTRV